MRIVAIDGSPSGSGKTATALGLVIEAARGAAGSATETSVVALAGDALGEAVEQALGAIRGADAVVLGSPVYRASYAFPLKTLLDHVPRGLWGEPDAPLAGKAVAVVATGASLHHFLAIDDLRNVLSGFFAAWVVPPGLYVPREGFDDGGLTEEYAAVAAVQGRALVALASALGQSADLAIVRPQA